MMVVGQQTLLTDPETDLDTTFDVLDETLPNADFVESTIKGQCFSGETARTETNVSSKNAEKSQLGSQRKVTEWMQHIDCDTSEVCYSCLYVFDYIYILYLIFILTVTYFELSYLK